MYNTIHVEPGVPNAAVDTKRFSGSYAANENRHKLKFSVDWATQISSAERQSWKSKSLINVLGGIFFGIWNDSFVLIWKGKCMENKAEKKEWFQLCYPKRRSYWFDEGRERGREQWRRWLDLIIEMNEKK